MAPYSDRLYMGDVAPAGAVVTLYTVPAGEVHVFRDIRLRSDAAGKLVQLFNDPSGSDVGVIVRRTLADTNDWTQTDGRATARGGDVIKFYADAGATVTVYLSGYRLTA